jgi:ribosomal protein L24E
MINLPAILLIGLGVGGCGFMSITDLPEWLPGQWDLAYYSVSQGGRTMYLPNLEVPQIPGGLPIATSLTFTQGSPTFDHSGGPVPPGKGKVTVKDGVVHLEIPAPATATIAKTPEGMVIRLDVPAQGAEFKAYYTRAQEQPQAKLPEWLPGQWDLASYDITHGRRTPDFPFGTGALPLAASLTFTQGGSTYEYSGDPVPPGEGKVTVKDGVVNIGLWPTNVSSLPAMVAETPEGIVVNFSHTIWGNEPSEFKVYYTRHRPI